MRINAYNLTAEQIEFQRKAAVRLGDKLSIQVCDNAAAGHYQSRCYVAGWVNEMAYVGGCESSESLRSE